MVLSSYSATTAGQIVSVHMHTGLAFSHEFYLFDHFLPLLFIQCDFKFPIFDPPQWRVVLQFLRVSQIFVVLNSGSP